MLFLNLNEFYLQLCVFDQKRDKHTDIATKLTPTQK